MYVTDTFLYFVIILLITLSLLVIYYIRKKLINFRHFNLTLVSLINKQTEKQIKIAKEVHSNSLQIRSSKQDIYRNIESLIALNYYLNEPIRGLGDWALSADALIEVVEATLRHKPKVILELGSGKSTYVLATVIKKFKLDSKIYSVDHEEKYLTKTIDEISTNNLSGLVIPVLAPLVKTKKNGQVWYDTACIAKALNGKKVDFVIIDGPPSVTSEQSRYPAIPELKDHLNSRFRIILDDYKRPDEQKIVERWRKLLDNPIVESVPTEKGLAIISGS